MRVWRDDKRPKASATDFGQHLERGALTKKNVANYIYMFKQKVRPPIFFLRDLRERALRFQDFKVVEMESVQKITQL